MMIYSIKLWIQILKTSLQSISNRTSSNKILSKKLNYWKLTCQTLKTTRSTSNNFKATLPSKFKNNRGALRKNGKITLVTITGQFQKSELTRFSSTKRAKRSTRKFSLSISMIILTLINLDIHELNCLKWVHIHSILKICCLLTLANHRLRSLTSCKEIWRWKDLRSKTL